MNTSRSVTDSPGDGEDVISLSQEPSEGKLTGSDVLLLGEMFDLVDDLQVFGEVLWEGVQADVDGGISTSTTTKEGQSKDCRD
jgi:hypothetical protein